MYTLQDAGEVFGVAEAIRQKLGTEDSYTVAQMRDAILSIPTSFTVGNGALIDAYAQSGSIEKENFVELVSGGTQKIEDRVSEERFILDWQLGT